jgi:hypothetical protein
MIAAISNLLGISKSNHVPSPKSLSIIDLNKIYHSQEFSWDCGLSVIIMVMRWSGRERCCRMNAYYERETPLWTIDIFSILITTKVFHTIEFYTMNIGIKENNHYKDIDYYQSSLKADEERVNGLFQKGHELQWPIKNVSDC